MLFCFYLATWSQEAILEGRINDRQGGSPIGAADAIVNGATVGITGASGRYLISGLKRGSNLDVTYKKQGYGPKNHMAPGRAQCIELRSGFTFSSLVEKKALPVVMNIVVGLSWLRLIFLSIVKTKFQVTADQTWLNTSQTLRL